MAEDEKSGKMAIIEEKFLIAQEIIEKRFRNLGSGKYSRILKMARRPTSEEYSKTVMITGAGLTLIGFIGYLIYVAMAYGVPALRDFLGI